MAPRTFYDYWVILYRWRRSVLTIVLSAVAIAVITNFVIDPVYEAKTTMFVPGSGTKLAFLTPNAVSGIARDVELPIPQQGLQQVLLGILKTRKLAEMVQDEYPKKPLSRLVSGDVQFEAGTNFLFNVYVRDGDPKLAAALAASFTKNFNLLIGGFSSAENQGIIQSLEAEIKLTSDRLAKARADLLAFQRNNNTTSLPDETALLIKQKGDFETAVFNARVTIPELEGRIRQTQKNLEQEAATYGASNLTTTSPLAEDLRRQIAEIEGQIASAKIELTTAHPDMVKLQAQSDEKKRMLEDEIKRIIGSSAKANGSLYESLRQNLAGLIVDQVSQQAKIGPLEGAIKEIDAKLAVIPKLSGTLADLNAEVQREENSLRQLEINYEEAKIQAPRELQSVVVVDAPIPPRKPIFPLLWINIPLAVGLGLVASVFFCFLADYIQNVRGSEGEPPVEVVP